MARAYKKRSSGRGKRGLKKGHKKSPAWRKAISEALKRYHRGKGKGRKRKTHHRRATGTRRRRTAKYYRRSKTADGGFSVKWHKRRKRRS